MKLKDYYSFYASDGLFLPTGSYSVEEISPQKMATVLKSQNKEALALQNHSYTTLINHKILK